MTRENTAGCDMLVNLYTLPEAPLLPAGVSIRRAFPADKSRLLGSIRLMAPSWSDEAEVALTKAQPSCFIALEAGKPIGFACYDASAKGFFGPTALKKAARGRGVGKALLIRTLEAMREEGYGYAIIGWVDEAAPFYEKSVNAVRIPGGDPQHSVYSRLIRFS